MTLSRRALVAGLGAVAVTGCATESKLQGYTGPAVTRIQVFKGRRKLQLLNGNRLLKSYDFELGFAPSGDKSFEGDGRTPDGAYLINRRNLNSRFHLSLGISYPNRDDIAYARSRGLSPGGDIFIHGTPNQFLNEDDWTWGCIAVTNDEIEEMYSMVKNGTPIYIYP